MSCFLRSACAYVALAPILCASVGCEPLPPPPVLGAPAEIATETSGDRSTMRELVWMNGRMLIRISRGERMCHEDARSNGCVQLSASDRRELARFFSDETFRTRWRRYRPCRQYGRVDEHAFAVTYADGHTIARELDAPIGSPMAGDCDRATRDAVVAIEDALVDRYLR